MGAVEQLIADMVSSGVDPVIIGRVAAAIAEASRGAGTSETDSVIARRRAYDRERKAAKKRNSGGIPPEQSGPEFHRNSTGIPPENAPLARVRDITSNSEIPGGTVVEVSARASTQPDWPEGNPFEALIADVGSPWLDPCKSPGLITTSGRLAAWKRDGASWVYDVLPAVRAACAKARGPIRTMKYFDASIGVSIAENRRAVDIPDAATLAAKAQGPPDIVARLGAEQAEARRRAFELLDAREARNG